MKTTGFIFLAVGSIFLIIQNAFYGYIDKDGIVHDSLFLPLGAIATIIGLLIFLTIGVVAGTKKLSAKNLK